jgi:hypothetical protein
VSISWSSISAGAMTAAVSLGSTVQSMGAAAAQALPTVTAQALPTVAGGGIQAVGHQAALVASTAAANASTAAATAATTLPQTAGAASVATTQAAESLAVVEKPAKALAAAAPRASFLARTAGFLSKALPIVTIGASALAGAQIVQEQGAQGLITTKQGRGAVLGAVGGALMLVPTPVTQVAAAGVLGAVAVNHFGGMYRHDTAQVHLPWQARGETRPQAD